MPDARADDQPDDARPERLAINLEMIEQATSVSKIQHLIHHYGDCTLTQSAAATLRVHGYPYSQHSLGTIVSQPKFRRNRVTKTKNNRSGTGEFVAGCGRKHA